MRNVIWAVLVLVVGNVVLSAQADSNWPQEPDGFMQYKFGMTQTEARKAPHRWVNALSRSVHNRNQLEGVLYIGDQIYGVSYYNFVDGKLANVSGEFSSDYFDAISAMFIERYGKPHRLVPETIQNSFGATFNNVKLSWIGKNVSVVILKYGNDLRYGNFTVGLNSHGEQIGKQHSEALKKAAKGL